MNMRIMQPIFGAFAVLLLAPSPNTLRAQKLADAPSAVMLANNLQQDAASPGTVAAPMPASTTASGMAAGGKGESSPQFSGPVSAIPEQLTRAEAEQIAIRNNPRITVSQLLARAQHQVYRETRAAYLPQLEGGAVGSKAYTGSRFTFDGLRSTRLITHAGGGLDFHQLITDFGHTSNLIASSKLYEKAQQQHALASELDVILIVDQAFYNALEAQALVQVAQQTVATRQTTEDQITELTKNKLRSDIDLAFADQDLARAKLLLLDAQSAYDQDINAMTSVLGFDHAMHYELVHNANNAAPPPPDQDVLVQMALKQRPDLIELDYDQQAAKKYSRAERDQVLPTLSTMGVVGGTPIRDDKYFTSNWFGAVGMNLRVPIFNGFLYTSEANAAEDRAKATQQNLRDLRDSVVRDVRNAWLQTNTSYQKIGVTEKLLEAANLGLDLGKARYKLGLSSIVELSQAQLEQTQASIENVNAHFEYELALAALNYQLGNLP